MMRKHKKTVALRSCVILMAIMILLSACSASPASSDSPPSASIEIAGANAVPLGSDPAGNELIVDSVVTAVIVKAAPASCEVAAKDSWESGGKSFTKYEITIKNIGDKKIQNWALTLSGAADISIDQSWNCSYTADGGDIILSPLEYNSEIAVSAEVSNVGIIAATSDKLSAKTLSLTMADGAKITVDCKAQTAEKTPTTPSVPPATADAVGALHVSGTKLVDEVGNAVQLRGVSTHGMAWFPEYINFDAFKTLRDDWGANVVRLAMYTAEYSGYCNGGDREKLKTLVDNGVQYASELGMYVIIDWHILSDFNPNTNKSDAIAFFNEMSVKYADYDNVIYEICNEPQNSPWASEIKPYAEELVATIRANDDDAVILVGTNTWSQDINEVVGNELDGENVMYVMHFYAATHGAQLRQRLQSALDAGVPVFVSECSICDASGNGGIDYASADAWLKLMNDNGVSFIAWSLSNKAEASALIKSDCTKLSGWTDSDLSETGLWFKAAISG